MKIRKAFKFELMPNGAQIRKMKQFCGCSRFVFNRALAWQNEQYEVDKSFKLSYYKLTSLLPAWNGGFLFAVPPQNTSRTCPCCGHTSKDNRKTQADFECVECCYQNNADVVGAINVLKRGQAIQAA